MAWPSSAGFDGASSVALAVVEAAPASVGATSGALLSVEEGAGGAVGVGGALLPLVTASLDDKRTDEDLDVLVRALLFSPPLGVGRGRRLLPEALRFEKFDEVEVVELAGEPLVEVLAKDVL